MKDPVAVYKPRTLAEGQEIAELLSESGIAAQVVTEEVVVARADAERAGEAFKTFPQLLAMGQPSLTPDASGQSFVTAVCEECGESSIFDGALLGSVQDCPHCGKFMDVAAGGEDLEWGNPEDEETAKPDEES
jgi:hypothetical protein